MARDPAAFLRGCCHLFYERLAARGPASDAPAAWVCGDLHLENFGSFRGDEGEVCFDVNDFDEACLAPAAWDLVRMQTSLVLAAASLGWSRRKGERLARAVPEAYARAIAEGRAGRLTRKTARGVVGALLAKVARRRADALLDGRAPVGGDHERHLVWDDPPTEASHAAPVAAGRRSRVERAMRRLGSREDRARRLRVLDVADRVAGLGSLG